MDEVNQTPVDFCPYVGLQPYSEADQDYFFGRERDSRIISSNLFAARLTILYGASGVGKSSVLQAGVFPRLQMSPHTAVVIFDGWADQNLLNTLKARCLEGILAAVDGKDIQLDLSLPLDEFLFSAAQLFGGTLLVILDQFEEYFLYHPEKDNSFDVEFARSVNRKDIDVNFLAAMREDTLSRLDRFRARIPNMLGNVLRLRHLDAASAREAMRKPLDVYNERHPGESGMSIEDALVETLIEDIQVEKLIIGQGGQGVVERSDGSEEGVRIEAPFLQLALTRLWDEERSQGSQVLRLETLEALGGAGRIIRTHMDSAMHALSAEEQETVADLFRFMVTPSGTKIAYTVADLEYYAKSKRPLEPMLKKLIEGSVRIIRSVSSPGEPGVIRYQIYHDVLAPAVLDWRARFESSKQSLNMFNLLVEKGDMEDAFKIYQEIIQRIPQHAFFPERFEVRRILAKGELGVAYLLQDQEEDRLIVGTILDDRYDFTKEELEQFASENAKLSSARISRILGFYQYHDAAYMLSEFIDGAPLRVRLVQGLSLSYLEAMEIAKQITEALEDGHRQGLPFLNLRPSNVVLSPDGVKLINYGISMLTSLHRDRKQHSKRYMDDYMAPEQLLGQQGDERSDIYALGTILYEMLIGHPPSVGRFYYPSAVHLEATEAVDILIDHARENNPARRFPSAEAMRMEMDRISMGSFGGGLTKLLRISLAWISERYKTFTSGRGLAFLLAGFALLLILSRLPLTAQITLSVRLLLPLLLNSLVISILSDLVIRALARRRGLGSLISAGNGTGGILGLVITLHLFRMIEGLGNVLLAKYIEVFFFIMLALAVFGTALALGIILAIAWGTERLVKSYATGFYWAFVAVLIIELILITLKIPMNVIQPF
ncbi:MAG TPA: serine/threonine-protein kinase [Anaerolineales bacterium]|nr:serine/threonine-protein kinase [Anaerolineales bacterium]